MSDISVDYVALYPIVNSLSPDNAVDNSATTTVTVSGADFAAGAAVTLEAWGSSIAASSTRVSATTLLVDIPANFFGGYSDVMVTNTNGATSSKPFWVKKMLGNFVGRPMDMGGNVTWSTAVWTAGGSASSSLAVKARSAASSDMSGASAWTSCSLLVNNGTLASGGCVTNGQRYLQYSVDYAYDLPAAYIATTTYDPPRLDDFSAGYEAVAASGTLISSPFFSSMANNVISGLTWNGSQPSGSAIKVQIRTAHDANGAPGTWTNWQGTSGDNSYYTTSSGNTINGGQSFGSGNEWFQYLIRLESDGQADPALSDINIEYAPSPNHIKIWGKTQMWGSVRMR